MDGMTVARPGAALAGLDDALIEALAQHAAQVDQEGAFPWESLEELHAAGVLALTARVADGGAAAGLARVSGIVRQAGRGCASTALILAMQLTHVRASGRSNWPERLKAAIGRSAGLSGALINALRVEPALGTPARGGLPATVARRVEGGWAISGRKIYSTGAPGLVWMLVFARTDAAAPQSGLFLVPAHRAVREAMDKAGGTVSATSTVQWMSMIEDGLPDEASRRIVSALAVDPLHMNGEDPSRYAVAVMAKLQADAVERQVKLLKSKLQRTNPLENAQEYGELFTALIAAENHHRSLRERAIGYS